MYIIVIEDDLGILELLKEIVESNIYCSEYNTFSCANDAIKSIKRKTPDLILLDYGLPDMNGREFIDILKDEFQEIPAFILSTGLGDEKIAVEMLRLGAKDYVIKDNNYLELMPSIVQRVCEDIENKKVREEVEQERDLLFEAIDQISDVIVITNLEGKIVYVNKVFENLTGYKSLEVIGEKTSILKSGIHDDSFYNELWSTIRKGNTWNGKFINRKKDGTTYHEEAIISPVKSKNGKIINYIAIKRDITNDEKIKAQLMQSEKMEAIGHLAGGIAHDFNNILSGIIGFSELGIDLSNKDTEIEDCFNQILSASDRAKKLVKQILSFSRKTQENKLPIHIKPVISEVVQLLRASLPATIGIEHSLERDTKPVLADAINIHEILMNLCTNAADAMHERGVLKLRLYEKKFEDDIVGKIGTSSKGEYSVIEIEDNGDGIDDEILDHIFEPFYTTKNIDNGTGMGLSVVFGIVKSHKGNIFVKSKIGRGTTFTVIIPKTDKEILANKKIKKEILGGKERIVLIDDEEIITLALEKILENKGYVVKSFNNSIEGYNYILENIELIDLVITDQTMPEMTGFQLSKKIKKINSDLPIILYTGYSNLVNKEKVIKAGIDEFCLKPINKTALTEKIRSLLDKKEFI